jgi:hypothetical protein
MAWPFAQAAAVKVDTASQQAAAKGCADSCWHAVALCITDSRAASGPTCQVANLCSRPALSLGLSHALVGGCSSDTHMGAKVQPATSSVATMSSKVSKPPCERPSSMLRASVTRGMELAR